MWSLYTGTVIIIKYHNNKICVFILLQSSILPFLQERHSSALDPVTRLKAGHPKLHGLMLKATVRQTQVSCATKNNNNPQNNNNIILLWEIGAVGSSQDLAEISGAGVKVLGWKLRNSINSIFRQFTKWHDRYQHHRFIATKKVQQYKACHSAEHISDHGKQANSNPK